MGRGASSQGPTVTLTASLGMREVWWWGLRLPSGLEHSLLETPRRPRHLSGLSRSSALLAVRAARTKPSLLGETRCAVRCWFLHGAFRETLRGAPRSGGAPVASSPLPIARGAAGCRALSSRCRCAVAIRVPPSSVGVFNANGASLAIENSSSSPRRFRAAITAGAWRPLQRAAPQTLC